MIFAKIKKNRVSSLRGKDYSVEVVRLDIQHKRELLNNYSVIYGQEKKDIDHTVNYLDKLLVESHKG
jgi:hypothetical protein